MARGQRTCFGVFEVVLIGSFVALATFSLTLAAVPVAGPIWFADPDWEHALATKYGAERFSGGLEEFLVREFFQDARNGTFVDVGSFDAVRGSNTYRLERDFGWSGLAIDADASLAPSYKIRPRSAFVVAFVGASDSGTATLHKSERAPGVASVNPEFVQPFGPAATTFEAPKRTLDSLLSEHAIEAIDFLSMDIELGEPAALQGFDIARHRPRLVCVEAHRPTRQWLLDYFARNGYVLIGDYLQADGLNLWFRPVEPHSQSGR